MYRPYLNLFRFLTLWVAAALLLVLLPSPLQGQQRNLRLILKDGSYQSVVKYEVQGDRVHYLSAERYEWEDIPVSLIDWDATKKYEGELSNRRPTKVHEETPEEREQREKEEANSPEVAPRLHLPGTGGVFLFDQYQSKPELAEITQNSSEMNSGKSVLRSKLNPIASTRQSIELKGEHAKVQSHLPRPTLYIDIDEGPQSTPLAERFRLVRLVVKKDTRIVANLKTTFTGKVSEQSNAVPVNVEKLGTAEWVKLAPAADLQPGEYAVVEMLGPHEINLYVWDFGVNAKAAANPNSVQPEKSSAEALPK